MYNGFLETELDIDFSFAATIILGNYPVSWKTAPHPRPNPKPQEDNQFQKNKKNSKWMLKQQNIVTLFTNESRRTLKHGRDQSQVHAIKR